MSTDVIAMSVAEATIQAPIEAIDLTQWVFTLTDAEYRACSTAHIAAAVTRSPEGKRMSINVEQVGNVMVQHYVEDIAERGHCRLVSQTDSIGPTIDSRTEVVVVWEFWVEAIDAGTTKFNNRVEAHAPAGYAEALTRRGIPIEKAKAGAQQAMGAHNAEETPLFAKDIERKALMDRWTC